MTATKKSFKKIDLSAPVWVPKVGEMCEVELAGFKTRCVIMSIDADGSGMATIAYETKNPELNRAMKRARAAVSLLREGTAPSSKLDQLAVLMKTGQWEAALKLAAKFQDLGDHEKEITQAANALKSPDFYRQIKKDPAALVEAGVAALKARYCK